MILDWFKYEAWPLGWLVRPSTGPLPPTVVVLSLYTADPGRSGRLMSAPETLYHRDDAILYIAYVILIWAAPIPADRGALQSVAIANTLDWLACPLVAEISCDLIVHYRFSAECIVSLI